MSAPLVLAADLDGTLADGSADARAELIAGVRASSDGRLLYVTGRSPASARSVLAAAALPAPDVLIADVGTTVLHGTGPEPVASIEAQIERLWPGSGPVRERLRAVEGLEEQAGVDAPRRVSYWIRPVRTRRLQAAADSDEFRARRPGDPSLDQEAAALARRVALRAAYALAPLEVDVLISANVFLDVLPRGVNKGSTLRRVLRWLNVDERGCIVAGDSLNDLALFETGLRGIVVGNCEPALRRRVANMKHVYRARGVGAAGVLEGLKHHGYLRGASSGGGRDGE